MKCKKIKPVMKWQDIPTQKTTEVIEEWRRMGIKEKVIKRDDKNESDSRMRIFAGSNAGF